MQRAHRDDANAHAAIEWLTTCARAGDTGALERALLLCGHQNWFWHISGQHRTARVAYDALLTLAADGAPSRGRALSWLGAGMVSTTTDEWERSLGEWNRGFEDGETLGDARIAAEGRMGVGYCNLSLGRIEAAAEALDDAIVRAAPVDAFMQAMAMTMKGMLLFATGDCEAGVKLVQEARRVQEPIGDHEGGGVAQSFLAQMTFAQGDPEKALTLYREALGMLETVGDHPEVARVHCEMGWTALAASDPRAAAESFRRAVHAYEGVGSARGTGQALLGLAAVEAAEDRSEQAVAIAAAAEAFLARAGTVVAHPMAPGLADQHRGAQGVDPEGHAGGARGPGRHADGGGRAGDGRGVVRPQETDRDRHAPSPTTASPRRSAPAGWGRCGGRPTPSSAARWRSRSCPRRLPTTPTGWRGSSARRRCWRASTTPTSPTSTVSRA